MRVAGLFSGIGGLELPLHRRGHESVLLCDSWNASQQVLRHNFPGVPVVGDVADVTSLPEVDVLTAGFPCTDLSQAGRTAGIRGRESGLVHHVFRLLRSSSVDWLVLENVRNMLVLDGGMAMQYLVNELEAQGFRWAYRLVDSRFSGVPQRRHRVLFVASQKEDPRSVLFADEAGEPGPDYYGEQAFGFYWTEGERGLGWAPDAVPPLKGGSGVGIPSPPAVWVPGAPLGRRLVTPSITEAEALQGFPRGWTASATHGTRNGPRWRLVGNAVTVGVSNWLASRLEEPGEQHPACSEAEATPVSSRWPNAAWGENGKAWTVNLSSWPVQRPYASLTDVMDLAACEPLSHRAAAGFLTRAERGSLRFVEEFLLDVKEHVNATQPQLPKTASA